MESFRMVYMIVVRTTTYESTSIYSVVPTIVYKPYLQLGPN